MNGVIIMQGQLKNGVCTLMRPVSVMYTFGKTSREDDVNNTHLWHYRLGHINKNRITRWKKVFLILVVVNHFRPMSLVFLLI